MTCQPGRLPFSPKRTKAPLYRQITADERYTLGALRQLGYAVAVIAQVLSRHRSTLFRELRRNATRHDGSDRPQLADWYARGSRGSGVRPGSPGDCAWSSGSASATRPSIATSGPTNGRAARSTAPSARGGGTNENTNGLIRQYAPKRQGMAHPTQQDCDAIARRLNHRPRKRLGYRTPEECYAR